jgi:plasmid stabilization system protein ParE
MTSPLSRTMSSADWCRRASTAARAWMLERRSGGCVLGIPGRRRCEAKSHLVLFRDLPDAEAVRVERVVHGPRKLRRLR